MPTASYNNVAFTPLSIVSFSVEPQWSEDRTEYLWSKYVVELTGLLNPLEMSYAGNPPVPTGGLGAPGSYPHETLQSIRHALSQPRRPLLLGLFGDVVLKAPAESYTPGEDFALDCTNGPIPQVLQIDRFDGNRTLHLRWRVETTIRECPGGAPANPALVSCRWGQADTVDEQHLTTRVTSGTAHFRTDVLAKEGKTPDDYRGLLFPLPPPEFRRIGLTCTADSNRGLLRFNVVDREQMFSIGITDPRPVDQGGVAGSGLIATPDVQYTVSTISAEGIAAPGRLVQVGVTCRGSKYSSTWRLTQEAVMVASRKLPMGRADAVILHAQIVQDVTNKVVNFGITMRVPPAQEQLRVNAAIDQITLFSDDGLRVDDPFQSEVAAGKNPQLPHDGVRGTFEGKLLVAALAAACGEAAALPHSEGVGEGVLGVQEEAPQFAMLVVPGDVLELEPTLISSQGNEGTGYTSYGLDIRYAKQYGRHHVPVAGPPGSPSLVLTASRPISVQRVRGTAERVGEFPDLPDPEVNDPNRRLLHTVILPPAPITNPTGAQPIWHVDFEYVYALLEARGAGDALPMGSLPWSTLYYTNNNVPLDRYVHGLIDESA